MVKIINIENAVLILSVIMLLQNYLKLQTTFWVRKREAYLIQCDNQTVVVFKPNFR